MRFIIGIFLILLAFLIFNDQWHFKVQLGDPASEQIDREIIQTLEAQNSAMHQKLVLSGYRIATDSAVEKQIVRYYINKFFGDQAERAEKVFICESLLYPELVHFNEDGGGDYGIAQINRNTWEELFEAYFGVDFEVGVFDIAMNIEFAKVIYDRSGSFSPWVCDKYV